MLKLVLDKEGEKQPPYTSSGRAKSVETCTDCSSRILRAHKNQIFYSNKCSFLKEKKKYTMPGTMLDPGSINDEQDKQKL